MVSALKSPHNRVDGGLTAPDPFNCATINTTLQNLAIAPGDTVVIYYAGHGFNLKTWNSDVFSTNPAQYVAGSPLSLQTPFLWCGSYDQDPNSVAVARWVSVKKPRLVIVIADSCNSFLYGPSPVPLGFAAVAAPPPPPIERRLRGLFLNSSGTVLVAGATPGQFGFYTGDGGKFTNQLLDIIEQGPDIEISWNDVAGQFTTMFTDYTPPGASSAYRYPQTPIAVISPGLIGK
jgi:hypothetical protein